MPPSINDFRSADICIVEQSGAIQPASNLSACENVAL